MNGVNFRYGKYMNGSCFALSQYMNGVGFVGSSRTSVPKIKASYPPPRGLTRRWRLYVGTCPDLLRGDGPRTPSLLVVSRDSFGPWTWARFRTGGRGRSGRCLCVFLMYFFYHLTCLCGCFDDLSALVGSWSL